MDARRHQEIAENAREAASGADPVVLADEIGKIAEDNQYIVFTDNHSDRDILKIVTSDEVMKAMADGGVKHLMLEGGVSTVQTTVINAYIDGEITKEQLDAFIEDSIDGPHTDMYGNELASEVEVETEVKRLAESAKAHGMHVHSLNQGEGLYTEETMQMSQEMDEDVGRRIVEDLKAGKDVADIDRDKIKEDLKAQNPDYAGLEERTDREYEQSTAEYERQATEMFDNDENLQAQAAQNGLSREVAIARMTEALWIQKRVQGDEHVAKNVKEFAGDEKVAIIYGQAHTVHRRGDLDSQLEKSGKTAVIAVYDDKDSMFESGPLRGAPKYPDFEKFLLPLDLLHCLE